MKKIKYILLLALLAFCTNGLYAQPNIPAGAETATKGLYSHHHSPGGHYQQQQQHHGQYGQHHGQHPQHHGQPPSHYGQRPQHHHPGQYHNGNHGNHGNYHHHPNNNRYDDDDDDDDDDEYDDDDDGEYYDDDDNYDCDGSDDGDDDGYYYDDDDQQYSDNGSNQSNDSGNNNSNVDYSNVDLNLNAISDSEVRAAVEYLNAIRSNPAAYSQEIGVDLSGIKARHPLRWNPTLAKAAQVKAQDMIDRNYFDHVDPDGCGMNIKLNNAGYTMCANFINDKSNNNFESIAGGNATGKASIKQLLYDGGASNDDAGHRVHLLAISDFWGNCYDIGIGLAKGGKYRYYWCVIIAKHCFDQQPYADK